MKPEQVNKDDDKASHKEEHLGSSAFITDIVIGMSDGLTVPFALAAGHSGAVHSNGVVITAGIAEMVAGSIAMGLGGYLAGKTEQGSERKKVNLNIFETLSKNYCSLIT